MSNENKNLPVLTESAASGLTEDNNLELTGLVSDKLTQVLGIIDKLQSLKNIAKEFRVEVVGSQGETLYEFKLQDVSFSIAYKGIINQLYKRAKDIHNQLKLLKF